MLWWRQFGPSVSLMRVPTVLSVLVVLLLMSAQETLQQVMYVTGCLGSDSVILHRGTSSDDIRAVFVYKGGEILGSDIIPAQGDFEGRLQISRQGQVTLSDLRLWDSGVFRVEMTRRDSKASTYVVLVVPDAPTTQHYGLHVQSRASPKGRDHVRLTCGTFTSLGYPPASVLWKDPEGRRLSSTGFDNGNYFLDVSDTSPPGNYSCLLHCGDSHHCCLPPASPLLLQADVHVKTSGPPETTAPNIAPEMTSVLQKTGEDMATAMAALVNGQVQGSLQATQYQLQAWKEEMEKKMEKRLTDIKSELENTLQKNLEEKNSTVSDVDTGRVRPTTPSHLVDTNTLRQIEANVYNKMENSIRAVYQHLDEGKRNMSHFRRKITHKINGFQKRVKTLRLNMKKHGVERHDQMIRGLMDKMSRQFKEVDQQIKDLETVNPVSDEVFRRFQEQFSEVTHRLNKGETTFGSFQTRVTNTVEDLQGKVTQLEDRFQRQGQGQRLVTLRPPENVDSGDIYNGTNSIVGRTDRKGVSQKTDHAVGERRTSGTNYVDQHGEGLPPSVNIPVSENCMDAWHKGGTVSGAYTLRPDGLEPQSFWCDMERGGGGWLVFQRRRDGSEEFYRPLKDYVDGFGVQNSNGEFWLGLDKLHLITSGRPHSLRVDLRTFDGVEAYAFYEHFRVLGSHQKYLMTVYGYSGTAGDGLIVHDNMAFSTWDDDNDQWSDGHCAANYRSAWWYAGCRICDLNAPYTSESDGIMWMYGDDTLGAGNIAFVEMKIRPEQ